METFPDEPGSIAEAESRTDLANGKRFAKLHGKEVHYVSGWNKFISWNRNRWFVDAGFMVESRAKHVSDAIWQEIADILPEVDLWTQSQLIAFARQSSSSRGIEAMLKMARSEPNMPIPHTKLDCNPWLFNVQNGTINLQTGQIQSHNPQDYITKIAPIKFDERAECPIWLQMLEEIFAESQSLIGFLQRFFGMTLTGVTQEHILPFFYGCGANGKSTVVETVLAVLGKDYSMRAAPDLLMVKANESHPTERADLFGKRFVAATEIEQGRRLNESLVKDLTGGDAIRARRMREDFWEFQPSHKIILVGNHKPNVRGQDHGIWRRLRLIPFMVTIPPDRQDKQLREKLLRESRGILNWMLQGCKEWQAEGLGEPAEVTAATESYRGEQDVVGAFIAERCIESASSKVKASDLFGEYERWCKLNGEHPIGGRRFGETMTERGYERYHSGGTWYRGIEITETF